MATFLIQVKKKKEYFPSSFINIFCFKSNGRILHYMYIGYIFHI